MHTLIENVKVLALATTSGGTTFLATSGTDGAFTNTGEIDTQGYDGVMFVTRIHNMPTSGGVLAVKVAGANTTGTTGADLTGSLQTLTDTTGNLKGCAAITNVYRPRHRYLSLVYQRTVSGFVASFEAILYNARSNPVTQTTGFTTNYAGVAGTALTLEGPVSGTA